MTNESTALANSKCKESLEELSKLTDNFLSMTKSPKPSLPSLPNELLLEISKYMNQKTLPRFMRVNKNLHILLETPLYILNNRRNWGLALDWALKNGNTTVAHKAIKACTNGIFCSRREHLGRALVDAVHLACQTWPAPSSKNSIAIAQLLMEGGAKMRNLRQVPRTVPIFEAAMTGITELVELLIAHGSPLEPPIWSYCPEHAGVSPLVPATIGGHIEIVELLLAHGADVNGQAYSSKSPLDYACEPGYAYPEIRKILKKYQLQTKKRNIVRRYYS
ncbi:uncharacterized protein N7511_011095 [Penicillium nucicola]|uniref:uncharacterized protein n=1 Tax=Penicillium nucicola TaxID=1850975 RepID=UPI002544D6A9|nr:uncharacterized protein N7511_011095 [Penicillium nucicola]KAJ5742694.1 hypothetical protein N7511_011095 [Penicillium nucicola]